MLTFRESGDIADAPGYPLPQPGVSADGHVLQCGPRLKVSHCVPPREVAGVGHHHRALHLVRDLVADDDAVGLLWCAPGELDGGEAWGGI